MSLKRAYEYEDTIPPGTAVVAGEAASKVALPGEAGAGVFAGVFSAYGAVQKERPNTDDTIGITVHGECKVRVSGVVTAFAFGRIANAAGDMAVIGESPVTPFTIAGFFLEDGLDGELVDFFVQPQYIPEIPAEAELPADTFHIVYDPNGADGGYAPVDPAEYAEGDEVTVLNNVGLLTKDGYTFGGWNTAANGSGTAYAAAATLEMPAAPVKLYAVWTA